MVRRAIVAAAVLALALVLTAKAAQAETRLVSLKALLAVDDPANPRPKSPTAPRLLAQADADEGTADEAVVDEETPAALLGLPPAPESDDTLTSARTPALQDEEEASVFKTWWFWALTAAIVGGTVALGVWAAQPEDQPAGLCSPGVIACFGDGR